MRDLSVLIPARNEMFLKRTVADVMAAKRANTEVIVVLDGAWPVEPLPDHPDLVLIHHSVSVGQRAAVNEAARHSQARFVMKLDAHCSIDEGFDAKLIEAAGTLGEDTTQIPAQYNHHAFDWVCRGCGTRQYQGPTPVACAACAKSGTEMLWFRDIVWKPRLSRLTTAWRFDRDLHFQYWSEFQRRPVARGDFPETMSCLGACFFMSRARYWQLGGMDEAHGSWGQMGTEVGCKSWLSGGRMVTNKKTWFSHMFRTQGGDFGFPYPLTGKEVERARRHSRQLWIEGSWPGQSRPLSWLIDHFAPVPGWSAADTGAGGAGVTDSRAAGSPAPAQEAPGRADVSIREAVGPPTKGILYYSDCRGDEPILTAVRNRLLRTGLPIVSVTLQPVPDFGTNIVLPLERGYLTMFKQILAGLEASDADVVYFAEHDVLYHPRHFEFVPPRADTFYYNENTWKVDSQSGQALFYYTKQTSGLCAYRDLLIEHYRKRVERVEREGYNRGMGFEPGCHRFPRGVDDHPAERWMSAVPNVDIRHGFNLTRNRWHQSQFRDKRSCRGWTMADAVPGWGTTKGRFAAFLKETEQ